MFFFFCFFFSLVLVAFGDWISPISNNVGRILPFLYLSSEINVYEMNKNDIFAVIDISTGD